MNYDMIYYVLGGLSALTTVIFYPTYRVLQHNTKEERQLEFKEITIDKTDKETNL